MTGLQLVVPCYNEAARLDGAAFTRFAASRPDARILFVDDGSTDGTGRLLAGLAAGATGQVSVLTLGSNGGKAEAVRRGIMAALATGPSYVGFWDADLSTSLDEVPALLEVFESHPHVEVVMGSRVKLMGREIRRGALRHYSGRIFATAASLALGIAVYDTQCGAKIFRAGDPVRAVFSEPFGSRWNFDVEILARYLRQKGKAGGDGIYEVPLRGWSDVPGSKLGAVDAIQAAWDLLRIARMK